MNFSGLHTGQCSWLKVAALIFCVLPWPTPNASATDTISNIPMEIRQKAAPANIMFVIDNSGSMDAEFATDEKWGYLDGAWYLFQLDSRERLLWRARWHGANRMFYDPNRQYNKWPDFDAPAHNQEDIGMAQMPLLRNDPRDADAAFDLSVVFHTSSVPPVLPTIPNSHYYAWHDADNNGVADDKEVWLVTLNFIAGGSVERHYFNFDLGNDGVLTHIPADRLVTASGVPADMRQVMTGANELVEVPESAVPAEIKAEWTKNDGTRYLPSPQEELLNFATWYTYHRKRLFAAIGAVSEAIGRLSGVQVGLYTINGADVGASEARTGVRPIKVALPDGTIGDDTQTLRDLLYQLQTSSEAPTPLNTAFQNVARYFDVEDTGGFAPTGQANTPCASAENGGACQQAFVIMISDGEYSDRSTTSNAEGDGPFAPPYHDDLPNTLADLVMSYYDTDLAKNLDNDVPTGSKDGNNRQHIVTYTIGFGVRGSIPIDDMDRDGTPDPSGCTYAENPYFLKKNCTVMPAWPTDMSITNARVDDLWHAAVNGHGQYFQAADAKALLDALFSIAADFTSRQTIGASSAVNSDQLTDGTTVYTGGYNGYEWTGDLLAYSFKKDLNGKITSEVDTTHPKWSAAEQLASHLDRIIFTTNGDGAWLDFTSAATGLNSAGFSEAQRRMLTIPGDVLTFDDSISYFRGKSDIAGVRKRGGSITGDNVLGDIVHSAPALLRTATDKNGTIFVGANDGMLHAFDAETGAERFAFIPSLVHDHLVDLSDPDYSHRYYVDASPVVEPLPFFDGMGVRTDNMYLLVSGLGRGGRGYFALDVTNADSINNAAATAAMVKWEYPSRSMSVAGLDTNGDGRVETNTATVGNPGSYTYRYEAAGSDGRDNDGDGYIDEAGEKALSIYDGETRIGLAYQDDDLGYSYSIPVVARCYLSANKARPTGGGDHPWVVFFGNGYDSYNGKAVLYVLDALSGKLIRKIDTGAGGETDRPRNGLSSPAVVDVDNDDKADFAYAGDLRGNLWKFDLRSRDPAKWRVAHENPAGQPQPMFTTAAGLGEIGQAITALPQVVHHNKNSGYIVVFGTGRFFNESDRADNNVQTLFGIWDNDTVLAVTDHIDNDEDGIADEPKEMRLDRKNYLGVWRRGTNSFSNHAGNLLKQEVLLQKTMRMTNAESGQTADATLRVTSDNSRASGGWWKSDNPNGYMGWYFDLPGQKEIDAAGGIETAGVSSADSAERVVKDVLIRDGKVIAVTFIPNDSACAAGGNSFLMELSAFTGDRLPTVQLDIDGDGRLTEGDLIAYGGGKYAVSGYGISGMANTPVFTGGSGNKGDDGTETMLIGSSSGAIVSIEEAKEASIAYWWEMTND
ncbi:MAG TPA: hypothetical protein DEB25_07045 [Desulfobulbaceae bacterium]|nr:hypothetical protein [Desulfobulbaceae bacterium]